MGNTRNEAAYKRQYRKTQIGKMRLYLSSLARRCRQKKLTFDLDENWLMIRIQNGRCEQTGIPFVFAANGTGPRSPWTLSIDRIDPSIGYTKTNSQAVIWAYNAAKGEGTDDDVRFMAKCLLGLIQPPAHMENTMLPIGRRNRNWAEILRDMDAGLVIAAQQE